MHSIYQAKSNANKMKKTYLFESNEFINCWQRKMFDYSISVFFLQIKDYIFWCKYICIYYVSRLKLLWNIISCMVYIQMERMDEHKVRRMGKKGSIYRSNLLVGNLLPEGSFMVSYIYTIYIYIDIIRVVTWRGKSNNMWYTSVKIGSFNLLPIDSCNPNRHFFHLHCVYYLDKKKPWLRDPVSTHIKVDRIYIKTYQQTGLILC